MEMDKIILAIYKEGFNCNPENKHPQTEISGRRNHGTMSGGGKGFQYVFSDHVPDCPSYLFDGRANCRFLLRIWEAHVIPQTIKELFGVVIPKYA
jgi:hypothetical protein